MRKILTPPICHPERKRWAKDLCKSCYEKARPKRKSDPVIDYANHLRKKFGVTMDYIDRMKKLQSYRCALCREEQKLVVDHDHETGRIRGLLCQKCNVALGGYEKLSMNHRLVRYLQYGETHPRLCDLE